MEYRAKLAFRYPKIACAIYSKPLVRSAHGGADAASPCVGGGTYPAHSNGVTCLEYGASAPSWVLILPFRCNSVNKGMKPLKRLEDEATEVAYSEETPTPGAPR